MTIPMTATKKLTYAGKRLAADDQFEAKTKGDARLLVAIGKAAYRTAAIAAAPVQKPMTADEVKRMRNAPPGPGGDNITVVEQGVKLAKPDDLADLRAEYEAKVGKRPFMGWDAETLRAKMAAHLAAPASDPE